MWSCGNVGRQCTHTMSAEGMSRHICISAAVACSVGVRPPGTKNSAYGGVTMPNVIRRICRISTVLSDSAKLENFSVLRWSLPWGAAQVAVHWLKARLHLPSPNHLGACHHHFSSTSSGNERLSAYRAGRSSLHGRQCSAAIGMEASENWRRLRHDLYGHFHWHPEPPLRSA